MHPFIQVLLLAALPAGGNFFGGLLAEVIPASKRILSMSLHAAAGIIIAVVGIELMPRTFEASHPWIPLVAFIGGGGIYIAADKTLHLIQAKLGEKGTAGGTAIFFAVSVDLFSDGILIGTGSTVAFSLAMLLALGQVTADIPEGFATIAAFRSAGASRSRRILLSAAFAIPVLVGAVIGYWGLRETADIYKYIVLAAAGGILLTASIEEMIVEAHETEDTPMTTLSLVIGFALFAFIAVYFGR